MGLHSQSKEIRNSMLDEYYSNDYQKYLFGKNAQSLGIRYFEKTIESFWVTKNPRKILELGGGSGEHLKFVQDVPEIKYVSLDLRQNITKNHQSEASTELLKKIEFVIGNAEILPFPNLEFDRVFSTCLLHHVDDVLAVLLEARRVAIAGGEIAFIVPTDPGLVNQFIKRVISYPKLRKISKIKPELIYALEHKNHIGGILELIKFVYQKDELRLHYRPFRIKSWNLNLLVVAHVIKSKS